MIVFGSLIYHYLAYVYLYFFPFFGNILNIFHCRVCIYYAILTYFFNPLSATHRIYRSLTTGNPKIRKIFALHSIDVKLSHVIV